MRYETTRRDFLRNSGLALGGAVLANQAKLIPSTHAQVDILINEPIGTISPNIYGHFVELLGGVVYDGIWVGENSRVANIGGIRKELVEHMRRMRAPIVRFPGGCAADSYDWRDGIGPREKRPRRTNFWFFDDKRKGNTSSKFDPNQFGTDEFVRFCRLIKAEPYLAANVRGLSARDFDLWIEYCNSPAGSTTLAARRAANGSPQPFNVRYWGVGNEAWGCGGNFTPDEYAVEYRKFVSWVPGYDVNLQFIASGPNSNDFSWTRNFLGRLAAKDGFSTIHGLSLHHYAANLGRGHTKGWDESKGDAVNFQDVDWYELLREGELMEGLITGHWKIMQEFEVGRKTKLVVDEWGPWYTPSTMIAPGYALSQMPTLRDAVFSAMTLDIFNRHADKVSIAACAQLINCLNSPFLAIEDKFVATPVFDVFEMYAAHQGGMALRTEFGADRTSYLRDGLATGFWGINGSASLKGKTLTVSIVRPDTKEPTAVDIRPRGATVLSARATTLTNAVLNAHNTFEHKNVVRPTEREIQVSGGAVTVEIPAASVNVLELTLA
jgi:alpha-L-arabinofuranosidase